MVMIYRNFKIEISFRGKEKDEDMNAIGICSGFQWHVEIFYKKQTKKS